MCRRLLYPAVLLAAFAAAQPPAFQRYRDHRIEVDVPYGWKARWLNERAFFLSKDSRNGPALLLEVRPYMATLDPGSMAASVRSVLGGSFRVVESRDSVTILERANPATRVATLMHPDPQRRFSVTAIYWAAAADYDSGGGLDLVQTVARSVSQPEPAGGARIVERTLGYAGPSQSSPGTGSNATRVATGTVFEGDPSRPLPPSEVNAALLAGAWENTKLDSHMDTGRLDYSAEAGALAITFLANEEFQIRYRKMLLSGVFRSETEVTETGRFTLAGDRITFRPASQQGWISVMNGRRQPLGPPGPARVYSIGVYGNYILLRGQCAPYQVDLGCGEDRGGTKRTLTFPFRRVR